jgi:hypothetical protein
MSGKLLAALALFAALSLAGCQGQNTNQSDNDANRPASAAMGGGGGGGGY